MKLEREFQPEWEVVMCNKVRRMPRTVSLRIRVHVGVCERKAAAQRYFLPRLEMSKICYYYSRKVDMQVASLAFVWGK